MKNRGIVAAVLASALAAACTDGACILVPEQPVRLSARDARSGSPVSLVGAVVTYTDVRGTHTLTSESATVALCCLRGVDRLRVEQRAYAAWDTTVAAPTAPPTGACEASPPADVVAALRPTASAARGPTRR